MSDDMTEARRARVQQAEERKRTMAELVEVILQDEKTNNELRRKLAYCQQEIAKGRDSGLVAVRKNLIAEATRKRSY